MSPANSGGRNILLLAYYYLPQITSGVQRAVRFAKYLPRSGYPTFVVCSNPGEGVSPLPRVAHVPNQATRIPKNSRLERLAVRVQRFLPYNEQLPWAPHAVAAGSAIYASDGLAAVISSSPPLSTHVAAWELKRRYGLKWLADFRDPLAGNPGRPRRWARPYDLALQFGIFASADAVTTVTDVIANEWRQRYPRWARKFHTLWNGFDPEERLGPEPIPPREYQILSHVGLLYAPRRPIALINSIERLISQGRLDAGKLRLRFIGEIPDSQSFYALPAVSALMARGCLEALDQFIPRQQALHEIATSDFLLLLDIDNLSKTGYAVPAKLYDYILMGRPILASVREESPVERILQQSGVPYVALRPDDLPEDVDRKLLGFLSLDTRPVTVSEWFLENFDGEHQAAYLSGLLESVLSH